jgi:hypothetical protein
LWTSAPPGNPIPREEWLAGVFGRRLLSFQAHPATRNSQTAVLS